jgi:hypothetical protein
VADVPIFDNFHRSRQKSLSCRGRSFGTFPFRLCCSNMLPSLEKVFALCQYRRAILWKIRIRNAISDLLNKIWAVPNDHFHVLLQYVELLFVGFDFIPEWVKWVFTNKVVRHIKRSRLTGFEDVKTLEVRLRSARQSAFRSAPSASSLPARTAVTLTPDAPWAQAFFLQAWTSSN